MSVAVQAQNAYNQDHKYGLFSNLEIGASAQYSRSFAVRPGNVGADLRVTKRISTHSRLRAMAGVNGFIRNGFDRYGTALLGLSADFLPFYVFLDGGLSFNPSSPQTVNPAADAGVGLQFDIGRNLRMFTEMGAIVTSNGINLYHSNGFIRLGYTCATGITDSDRNALSEGKRDKQLLAELSEENRSMHAEVTRLSEANSQLEFTLQKATATIESVSKMLSECKEAPPQSVTEEVLTVYFEHASTDITDADAARLRRFAEAISGGQGYYRIDGYTSADGHPNNNRRIAQQRAEAVYDYLVSLGVETYRLGAVGMGIGTEYGGEAALNRIARITKVTQ